MPATRHLIALRQSRSPLKYPVSAALIALRRRAVLQNHRAILQPQQFPHARLIILPIQRAQHAVGIGHQQRDADRRFQPVETECFRRLGVHGFVLAVLDIVISAEVRIGHRTFHDRRASVHPKSGYRLGERSMIWIANVAGGAGRGTACLFSGSGDVSLDQAAGPEDLSVIRWRRRTIPRCSPPTRGSITAFSPPD